MSPNQDPLSPDKSAEPPLDGTRLESDDEIRQVIQARRARLAAQTQQQPLAAQSKAPAAAVATVEAQAERPVQRPPIALLCILDDGKADGEWVRLRADATVIGRSEGDVRLPHDGLVSTRHAQVVRH